MADKHLSLKNEFVPQLRNACGGSRRICRCGLVIAMTEKEDLYRLLADIDRRDAAASRVDNRLLRTRTQDDFGLVYKTNENARVEDPEPVFSPMQVRAIGAALS